MCNEQLIEKETRVFPDVLREVFNRKDTKKERSLRND